MKTVIFETTIGNAARKIYELRPDSDFSSSFNRHSRKQNVSQNGFEALRGILGNGVRFVECACEDDLNFKSEAISNLDLDERIRARCFVFMW